MWYVNNLINCLHSSPYLTISVQIQTFGGSCITDRQCDGTLQLVCNGSICVCAGSTAAGTWFWNGTQCGKYPSFHIELNENLNEKYS